MVSSRVATLDIMRNAAALLRGLEPAEWSDLAGNLGSDLPARAAAVLPAPRASTDDDEEDDLEPVVPLAPGSDVEEEEEFDLEDFDDDFDDDFEGEPDEDLERFEQELNGDPEAPERGESGDDGEFDEDGGGGPDADD